MRFFSEKSDFFADVKNPAYEVVIVDFDNTLLLGNSTELFIDNSHPRWLAWILSFAGRGVARIIFRDAAKYTSWCDYFRVLFVVIGMPWSLSVWRRFAKKVAAQRLNKELCEGLKKGEREIVWVASLGFRQLISPILHELGGNYQLVCSSIIAPVSNIRSHGKVAALRSLGVSCEKSLVITDSADDEELLCRAAKGYLIQWEVGGMLPPAYCPLRFTAEGKYSPIVIISQHLAQNMVIIGLAYFSGLRSVWLLCLLYISFFAIYEIGYYENDFIAAKYEKSPKIYPGSKNFREYAIYTQAWVWVAVMCLFVAAATSPVSALIWFLFLILVRVTYVIYNLVSPRNRVSLYALLQVYKYFGYVLILTPCFVGWLLLASQTFRQIIGYARYRYWGSNPAELPDHRVRLFCFAILFVFAAGLAGDRFFRDAPTVQTWLIVVWVIFSAIVEVYKGLYPFARAVSRTIRLRGK